MPPPLGFIRELTPRACEVWSSMIGLALEPHYESLPQAEGQRHWSGTITLSGGWRGTVTLSCTEPMARMIAAAMMAIEAEAVTNNEIEDVIGELANILGGQAKQVLGGNCVLSLPSVIRGAGSRTIETHLHPVAMLHFCCEGHRVEVAIVGPTAAATIPNVTRTLET